LAKINRYLILFLKSIPIGLANTLPGVSGGTIALVLSVYETLINSIKKIKVKNLAVIGTGAAAGIFIGSAVITDFYEANPLLVNYFLFGLVLTSAHSTFRRVNRFDFIKLIYTSAAFAAALFFSMEINLSIQSSGLIRYFIGGFFGSIAMILPGISGGTLLILLGLYYPLLSAVQNFDLIFLSAFGLGIAAGLLIFAWIFSFLLKKYEEHIMAVLTGLILGSSAAVLPEKIILNGFFVFALGAVIIFILEFIGRKT